MYKAPIIILVGILITAAILTGVTVYVLEHICTTNAVLLGECN